MRKEVMPLLWLATAALVLVTCPRPYGHVQAASLPSDTGGDRSPYCSTILMQTTFQEKNCHNSFQRFQTSANNVLHLMCCIGIFPMYKVDNNYTEYIDKSLFSYISTHVSTVAEEPEVARFIRDCYVIVDLKNPNSPKLSDMDYINWKYTKVCQV